jgi:hypothetical protein
MAKDDGVYLVNGETYVPTATPQARKIKDTPGTNITGWFKANETTVYIVLAGAVIGLIAYFYFKNQQASSSSTAGTTDTSTTGVSGSPSPTDGSTSPGNSPDFSQLENLLTSLQTNEATDLKDIQALQKQEASEKKTTTKKKHHKKKSTKSKGGADSDVESEDGYGYGGGFNPVSSERYQDLYVLRGGPHRNTGHRIVYSVG